MTMATTMDVAGPQQVGYPAAPAGPAPLKRKWCGQGTIRNKQRYSNNIHKEVREQRHGLGHLQKQSRFKGRKLYGKRRVPKSVPRAPYNDNSFLMRVRRSGGLELSLVSLTPRSFVSSPKDSSYKLDTYEDFVDHEDYGYGSMTGLIRLRRGEDGDQSSGSSTVENGSCDEKLYVEYPSVPHADSAEQVEQRLDRGVSRFEMARPPSQEFREVREARQDSHIQYLEDENLVLKDRLFLMQQEVNQLRQRFHGGQKCIIVDESDESDD